jgi:hypothetical protein
MPCLASDYNPAWVDVSCYNQLDKKVTHPFSAPCGSVSAFAVEVSDGWRHYLATIDSGALFIQRASNSLDDWTTVDLSTSCDDVDIALDKTGSSQTLFYVLDVAGSIKLYTAPAEGNTLTLSATIGSGAAPKSISNAGLLFVYRVSGTTVVGQILDVAGNVVKTDFTAIATIDASSRIDVKWSASGAGSRRIELYCIVAGVVTQYTSPDGITFS